MRRMTTGRPSIARKRPAKSSVWSFSSCARAESKTLTDSRSSAVRSFGSLCLAAVAAWALRIIRAPSAAGPPRRTCARCGRGRCPGRRRHARARRRAGSRRWPIPGGAERHRPSRGAGEVMLVLETGSIVGQLAGEDLAGGAVDADHVALLDDARSPRASRASHSRSSTTRRPRRTAGPSRAPRRPRARSRRRAPSARPWPRSCRAHRPGWSRCAPG